MSNSQDNGAGVGGGNAFADGDVLRPYQEAVEEAQKEVRRRTKKRDEAEVELEEYKKEMKDKGKSPSDIKKNADVLVLEKDLATAEAELADAEAKLASARAHAARAQGREKDAEGYEKEAEGHRHAAHDIRASMNAGGYNDTLVRGMNGLQIYGVGSVEGLKTILKGKIGMDFPGEDPNLIALVKTEYPLVHREEAMKNIEEHAKQHIDDASSDKDRHRVVVLHGAPGTGKTRMLEEIPSILESVSGSGNGTTSPMRNAIASNLVPIIIPFGNGGALVKGEMDLEPAVLLALRVLCYYVSGKDGNASLEKMVKVQDINNLTLTTVLEYIKARETAMNRGGDIMVFIGLDDFQKLGDKFTPEVVTKLCNKMCNSGVHGVHIYAALAGTDPTNVYAVKTTSGYQFKPISLPLLDQGDVLALVETKRTVFGDDEITTLYNNSEFLHYAASIGYPIVVVHFLEELISRKGSLGTDGIIGEAFNTAVSQYWSRIGARIVPILDDTVIAHVVIGDKVGCNDLVSECTWNELASKGYVHFVDVDAEGYTGRVVVPPAIFRAFLPKTDNHTAFHKAVYECLAPGTNWDNWEQFCAKYIAARRMAYHILGKTEMSLSDFYEGVTWGRSVTNYKIWRVSCPAEAKIPTLTRIYKVSSDLVQQATDSSVHICCSNQDAIDIIYKIQDSRYVLIQCKWENRNGSPVHVQTALDFANACGSECLVVWCSKRPVTNDGVVLLGPAEFRSFYGPTFASLIKFEEGTSLIVTVLLTSYLASLPVNPNTASVEALMLVPRVGAAIAKAIVKARAKELKEGRSGFVSFKDMRDKAIYGSSGHSMRMPNNLESFFAFTT